jgi:hypothetical protein
MYSKWIRRQYECMFTDKAFGKLFTIYEYLNTPLNSFSFNGMGIIFRAVIFLSLCKQFRHPSYFSMSLYPLSLE